MADRGKGNDSARARSRFLEAYDAGLARWPVAVEPVDVATRFGNTRVNVCGRDDAPPLMMIHGGGATSSVWFANVGELSRTHRVYAVDVIGDVGRTVADGVRVRSADDLMAWLDAVLDRLQLPRAGLCGHSYGGWLALRYAMHAPERVNRLALLDPTDCFAGLSASYRLHALPLLARRSGPRMRALVRWETGDRPLDPEWLNLMALGAELPSTVVLPRRPGNEALCRLETPTLLLLAEHSKAHDIDRIAAAAQNIPEITTGLLAGASHHTIPTEHSTQLNDELAGFFAAAALPRKSRADGA